MKTPKNIEEIWNETESCLFFLRINKLISETEVENVRQRLQKLASRISRAQKNIV